MKPLYRSVLGILATVTIVGILTISSQQLFAPRDCGGCVEFQKLSDEFEKNVLNAAVDDPTTIKGLVDEFSQKVLDLFPPLTSP
jgi:hypothetical protein